MRILRLILLAAVFLAAGCGSSGSKTHPAPAPPPPPPAGPPATAGTGSVKATLYAPTHTPKVKARWPYRVKVVDRRGRSLPGRITVQIVDPLGTAHPATYDDTKRNIAGMRFPGVFRDYLQFPSDARNVTLTVRVAVKTSKGQVTLTYPVTPR
jgi:hypothetical protein